MPVNLEQIVASTRARLTQTKAATDLHELQRRAALHRPRGFAAALRRAAADGIAIIAELKKASPSRGLIRADFDVRDLASQLAHAGAAALSVLTDERFFQGSLMHLAEASEAASLPCLRKDFIIDEFQVLEALAWRADAILLIVAALEGDQLPRLLRHARELELDVLCEVHDERELARAVAAGCDIIGVNSRDLRTFQVHQETALRLAPLVPQNALRVAESGISTADDIHRLRSAGYQALLVGESLMRAPDPGKALSQLLAAGQAKKVPSC